MKRLYCPCKSYSVENQYLKHSNLILILLWSKNIWIIFLDILFLCHRNTYLQCTKEQHVLFVLLEMLFNLEEVKDMRAFVNNPDTLKYVL